MGVTWFGLAVALLLAACGASVDAATVEPAPELEAGRQVITFDYEGEERAYILYVPPGYLDSWQDPWPTVMFLHGSGEQGTNPRRVMTVPPLDAITLGERDYPFILVAPHIGFGVDWRDEVAYANAALADAATRVSVDRERIAVTGFSLGGQGVWAYAQAYPDVAARLAPVAGFWGQDGTLPANYCDAIQRPVWIHHSGDDEAVPVIASQLMVQAAEDECGTSVRYTEYEGLTHAQTAHTVYADEAFIRWLAGE